MTVNQVTRLITDISSISDYHEDSSPQVFLTVQRIFIITQMFSMLGLYTMAFRSKHQSFNNIRNYIMSLYVLILLILTILLKFDEIPENVKLVGIEIHST